MTTSKPRLQRIHLFFFRMFLLLLLVLLSLFAQQQVRVRAVSTQQAEIAALQQQVEELGQIRVIVQLDVPFVPESELTVARGAQLQQQVIDLAQQEIVAALPEQAAVVTQFETIPFMALEVDAVALEMLSTKPQGS